VIDADRSGTREMKLRTRGVELDQKLAAREAGNQRSDVDDEHLRGTTTVTAGGRNREGRGERVVREIENITRKPMVGFVGPEEDGRRRR
jgi:hypothetical protein